MALNDCAIQMGYTKDCKDSIGGIKTIYVAAVGNIASLVHASGTVSTITMSGSTKFYTFQLEQNVATASDNPKPNGPNGTTYFEHNTSFTIPKRSATQSWHLKTLAVNDTAQIVLDQNNKYWLLGYENGMKMQDSTAPFGTAMADLNGYQFVFLGQERTMALEIPSNLISAIIA